MNLFNKILVSLTCTAAFATPFAAQASPQITVRDVRTEPDTNHIIVPESFEIDVHELMKSWYLNRYAIIDKDADSRKSVVLEDRDYIERLQKLPTTIEMPFNDIVRSFIKMYVERKKALVESMVGLSMYYNPIFEDALDRYGMPMELRNLAVIESALNPNAVSKAGATGLWQFMTSTAQGEGLEVNSLVDERRDPYRSTDAAARYLKKLFDTYGDWTLAIAAYNCGPGNVNKALRRAGGGKKDFWEIYNFLPTETRNYIPAFIAANYAMAYYKEHNISPVVARQPVIVDTVSINKRVHFQQISDVLGVPMEELRALNPQYRADLIPGDIHGYTLILPHLQTLCYVAYEDSIVNHDAELYARRDIVEPGVFRKVNENGVEYVEQTVVKYHKVKRNETVASVARLYGVNQSEVIRANRGSKTLKRGTTLKINVVERKAIPIEQTNDSTASVAPAVDVTVTNDSTSVQTETVAPAKVETPADSVSGAAAQVSSAMNTSTRNQQQRQQTAAPAATKYKVRSGDNLYKIATRHGITVDALKKANNLKSDDIKAGQTLTIPPKAPARKSSTRRRR